MCCFCCLDFCWNDLKVASKYIDLKNLGYICPFVNIIAATVNTDFDFTQIAIEYVIFGLEIIGIWKVIFHFSFKCELFRLKKSF